MNVPDRPIDLVLCSQKKEGTIYSSRQYMKESLRVLNVYVILAVKPMKISRTEGN